MNKKVIFFIQILGLILAASEYNFNIPDFPTSTLDMTCTWVNCNKELLAYQNKFPSTDPNYFTNFNMMKCTSYMDKTARSLCLKTINFDSQVQEFKDLTNCILKNCYYSDWNTCRSQNQICKYCTDFKSCQNFQDNTDYQNADSVKGNCVQTGVAQNCSQFPDKNGIALLACTSYQQRLCREQWIKNNWASTQACQFCEIVDFTNYSSSKILSIISAILILFSFF
ncbi:hypothetical protein TTHERM_00898310 (macronuclear) [Tetrahymena thermophila SB210]|uniref:Transmembrane protein n=1 Tax=Tetrahymena thermophila (strain SB210) TaxID=312017 RepID=Q23YD3_TETTS|nr:hypothetical protein TTHERM_00898310 [Tetrahymena thermophila SB210]EAS01531.1 hypothetical protein TTHERM_00898310 [Tetrahymena thermophila SB210]|eukprot:XP_001021776.1 hypothetical protein TTHERM_00898310 [Tetrahymena thermophila SB210]